MVVGSGGREHALAWRLARDAAVEHVWVAPGNAGVTGAKTTRLAANDIGQWVAAAKEHCIDLTVVGPEAPLADGIADQFASANLKLLGPSAQAAKLEASKAHAKNWMTRLNIPTAAYCCADELAQVERWLASRPPPYVLKADGLAAGKGVEIKATAKQALQAARQMLAGKYGASSRRLVLEEFLQGEELTFTALCAGRSAAALPCVADYKRLAAGERGPNTGGMGACCPAPALEERGLHPGRLLEQFVLPLLDALAGAGTPYCGFLYAGLIVDRTGQARALEYNVRLGDPEAQVLLPLWRGACAQVLQAAACGEIASDALAWDDCASVCVVLAAPGYPRRPKLGIRLPTPAAGEADMLFHANTGYDQQGGLISGAGRVWGATSWRKKRSAACSAAYALAAKARFPGAQLRADVAAQWRQN